MESKDMGMMSMGVGDQPMKDINMDMASMGGGQPPSMSNMDMGMGMGKMPMHDTFYWGRNAIVLFAGWPGDPNRNIGMYVFSVVVVFFLAFTVELLSVAAQKSKLGAVILTLVHAVRMCLAYMVMLAAMSFNIGIFIAVIVGHTFGFFLVKARSVVTAGSRG